MKSECDRVTEAAESGDVRAVEAYLDRGGNIEAKDTRIGAVSHPYKYIVLVLVWPCFASPGALFARDMAYRDVM